MPGEKNISTTHFFSRIMLALIDQAKKDSNAATVSSHQTKIVNRILVAYLFIFHSPYTMNRGEKSLDSEAKNAIYGLINELIASAKIGTAPDASELSVENQNMSDEADKFAVSAKQVIPKANPDDLEEGQVALYKSALKQIISSYSTNLSEFTSNLPSPLVHGMQRDDEKEGTDYRFKGTIDAGRYHQTSSNDACCFTVCGDLCSCMSDHCWLYNGPYSCDASTHGLCSDSCCNDCGNNCCSCQDLSCDKPDECCAVVCSPCAVCGYVGDKVCGCQSGVPAAPSNVSTTPAPGLQSYISITASVPRNKDQVWCLTQKLQQSAKYFDKLLNLKSCHMSFVPAHLHGGLVTFASSLLCLGAGVMMAPHFFRRVLKLKNMCATKRREWSRANDRRNILSLLCCIGSCYLGLAEWNPWHSIRTATLLSWLSLQGPCSSNRLDIMLSSEGNCPGSAESIGCCGYYDNAIELEMILKIIEENSSNSNYSQWRQKVNNIITGDTTHLDYLIQNIQTKFNQYDEVIKKAKSSSFLLSCCARILAICCNTSSRYSRGVCSKFTIQTSLLRMLSYCVYCENEASYNAPLLPTTTKTNNIFAIPPASNSFIGIGPKIKIV